MYKLTKMDIQPSPSSIPQLIDTGRIEEALQLIDTALGHSGDNYELYLLKGKAHLKNQQWHLAQSAFLKADELNPQGNAREYCTLIEDIMQFYHKDYYNP